MIGQPSSALKSEFISVIQSSEHDKADNLFPFAGPPKLPTDEEILKLYWFLRDQAGTKNGQVSKVEIANKEINDHGEKRNKF